MSKSGRTIMETGRDAVGIFPAIAFYLFGPLVWAAHLTFVYGPQSAICAFGKGAPSADMAVQWLLGGVTAGSLALIALAIAFPFALAVALRFHRVADPEDRFAVRVMRLLAWLSLAGVLWAGATGFILDPCAQLR